MYCDVCGSKLPETEENFGLCKICGAKLQTEGKVNYYYINKDAANGGGNNNKKIKKKFPQPRLIAVLCLVVILASAGIFFAVRENLDGVQIKISAVSELAPNFIYIGQFSEGLAVVAIGGSYSVRYGYADVTGEIVIPCEYDYANSFREGIAWVVKDNKFGCVNTSGEIVVPFDYDYMGEFFGGLAWAVKNNKYGYINASGEIVIPFEYDNAGDFTRGLAVVTKGNKSGLIDKEENVVVPFEYDWISSPYYSYVEFFTLNQNGKFGLTDTAGNFILECVYDEINLTAGGNLIFVKQKNKWSMIEIENYPPALPPERYYDPYRLNYR